MAWLEDQAAYGRIDGQPVKAQGWMAASFRHLTSRALDPFPHHHNVVANTVTLADGCHRGLDTRGLYRHAHAASALATAEMRHQLSLRLGVRWRPGRKAGGWEIAGIDDRVIGEFSKRCSEIDDALRELEAEIGRGAHPNEIEHIVLRTRPAKSQTPAATLTEGWRQRAAALGLDTQALEALGKHTLMVETPDPETEFSSLCTPDGICAGGSVFFRTEALAALANHPVPMRHGPPQPLLVGAARLESMVDEFLASRHIIQVNRGEDPLFTTVEMLGSRTDRHPIQQRAAPRRPPRPPRRCRRRVGETCSLHRRAAGPGRVVVRERSPLPSRHRPGRAGKTTTVAACADAWNAAGYRVLGTAVKGEAARTLAAATGIECETVAWYLAHNDPQDLPLDARNGALGTIVALQPHPEDRSRDTLSVDFDGIGVIDLPRSFFDHHRTTGGHAEVGMDHAYALTSYAVQGSTRDVSTSRIDATTTRAETYVDITRGRHANHLYLTATTDPLGGEALPRLPAQPADKAVAHRLQHATGELTAWELAHPVGSLPVARQGSASNGDDGRQVACGEDVRATA